MTVTSVASSVHKSTPGKPKVTARLKMNATLPVLHHRHPYEGGDREQQRVPELLPEHLDGMAGVLVMAGRMTGRMRAMLVRSSRSRRGRNTRGGRHCVMVMIRMPRVVPLRWMITWHTAPSS